MAEQFDDPELDLSGLSYEQAQQYATTYIKTLRQLEATFDSRLKDILQWEKRLELAREKGAADLEKAAEQKVRQLRSDAAQLKLEKIELEAKVEKLKVRAKALVPGMQPGRSRALLEQFEQMLGPDAALEGRFDREAKQQALEDELAALKAKMKKD
jgi:phage shock protein A